MKLFHKGKRTFYVNAGQHLPDGIFKPDMVVDFPEEEGRKLHKVYHRELISVDDATKPFNGPAEAPAKKPKQQDF